MNEKKSIYKKWWFWVLSPIVLIILIGILAGNEDQKEVTTPALTTPSVTSEQTTEPAPTPTPTPTPNPVAKQATWQLIKSWSGNSTKKTEPFTITGKQWRIVWSNKDTTGFGGTILQVMVYKPEGSLPVEIAVNAQEGSDTSYIYKSGEFYLDINAANGAWTIKVEELR